jgi:phosphohistidine phosphatase SixA
MRRYILLARHGSVDHDPDKPDREQKLAKGGEDIRQVAYRLADHLRVQPETEAIIIGEIWHGSYRQVRETAGIFEKMIETHVDTFRLQQVRECKALDPDRFWRAEKPDERHQVGEWLLKGFKEYPEEFGENRLEEIPYELGEHKAKANAILVVGHAPQIGWTAEGILRQPQPIARSELLCIAVSDSQLDRLLKRDRWLMWVISPSDAKATKELRDKIDSKMKLAGVLGGLITGILGLLLGSLLDPEKLSSLGCASRLDTYISAGLFLVALGLYLATMYAYDRLLMPTRFWAEKAARKDRRWLVQRPPSSATWVLYQNMIRVWNWLFTPATWAVIAGLLFLAHAVFHPDWIVVAGIVPLLLFFAWYYRHFRPTLGTED